MILVTGGTGFLGAYIIRNLIQKGYAVRAIRRSPKIPFFMEAAVADKVEWVEGDILDVMGLEEAMQGVEAVIHSAAVVSFHERDRQQLYKVNVEGTANVVNMAIEANVKRLLHVSSIAALGRTGNTETVTEEKKWLDTKHHTHYAISKHGAEMEVWRGFTEGLDGVIINPSTVLGFGDWNTSSCAIFKNVYKGFPWYTRGINGFVGVEDVAEAAVQLLGSSINGKRFIINGDNISFQQLFNSIAAAFGKEKPSREATPLLGEIAWRVEAVKAFLNGTLPLLTKETAGVAQSKTYFDSTALLKVLPSFSYTPLEQVIKSACPQYIKALQSGVLTL